MGDEVNCHVRHGEQSYLSYDSMRALLSRIVLGGA